MRFFQSEQVIKLRFWGRKNNLSTLDSFCESSLNTCLVHTVQCNSDLAHCYIRDVI